VYTFGREQLLPDSVLKSIIRYDDRGNITERESFEKGTKLTTKYKYQYSLDGGLKQITLENSSGDNPPYERILIIHDSLGREYQKLTYDRDGKETAAEFKQYGDNDQLIAVYRKDNAGKYYRQTAFHYDNFGQLSKLDEYDNKNNNNFSVTCKADKDLMSNSVSFSDATNNFYLHLDYYYDNKGRIARKEFDKSFGTANSMAAMPPFYSDWNRDFNPPYRYDSSGYPIGYRSPNSIAEQSVNATRDFIASNEWGFYGTPSAATVKNYDQYLYNNDDTVAEIITYMQVQRGKKKVPSAMEKHYYFRN